MSRVTAKGHDTNSSKRSLPTVTYSPDIFFPGGREKNTKPFVKITSFPAIVLTSTLLTRYPVCMCVCVCVCVYVFSLFITIYEFAVHMRNTCNSMYTRVNKNPSVWNFLSRTGSDVRYRCHHNSSRFTFPIFAHSCRFSVLHSLQSITPRIY